MDPYESLNLVLQVFDTAKDASVEGSALQLSEPAFDCIEPRGTCRGEMKLYPRVFFEPGINVGSLMGAAVIKDDVEVQVL